VTDSYHSFFIVVMLVAIVLVTIHLSRSVLTRIRVPPLVGYILLGFVLRLADLRWEILSVDGEKVFEFLATIGLMASLFRIGLESNIRALLSQLRKASIVWIGDVGMSGFIGFLMAYYLLDLSLVPSLCCGVALTATSVGASVRVWHNMGALKSPKGELLLDVAELDDVSGIILMALLFAILPVLRNAEQADLLLTILKSAGLIMLRFVIFATVCLLFSLYLEPHMTRWFKSISSPPRPMLLVTGVGFLLAAVAGVMGFSVAIGAFFAGLAFSRDPKAVRMDASFKTLFELFSPFFFVGIGLNLQPFGLLAGLGIGVVLLAAAFVGKLVGHGITTSFLVGWTGFLLIGTSMIPRAEIAMIIMQRGLQAGPWAVPPEVFSGMAIVSMGTCLAAPLIVRPMLERWGVHGGADGP
jgi:Kef-type K+ transport system membrane component KefB